MGRVKKEEDNGARTQIARLDGLKVKSSRLKRCSARGRVGVDIAKLKLDRLKAESPILKELIERKQAYLDAIGGEIALLNYFELHNPNPKPKFDSQGFQECPQQGVSERERSLVRNASSHFPLEQPCWKPCWINYTPYFLYEFASGYALFEAHGVNELFLSNFYNPSSPRFKSYEEFLKRSDQIFTLKAFHPFSSTVDALVQMNAVSNSRLSPHLKNFLADNLPKSLYAGCYVTTCDDDMLDNIRTTMGMSYVCGDHGDNLTRGLRMNIDKYIDGLKPKDVEKAQMNLARLYSRQMCTTMDVECSIRVSSPSLQRVVVVPHRLEGIFIAKGKEDFICTRNLVPGESMYDEELIFVQNEDGTEVEYKAWNPLRSKLATAILCGVTNIWVKPGSRILYLGDDVCQITLSHLSDLVGLDGLVYVVGLSDVAVNMAEKRSNVITVYQKPSDYWTYRMVVGMVDVIYAEYEHPDEVSTIIKNAGLYLRAGGHYLVYTRVCFFTMILVEYT
ncbi:putative fibrillarin-like [Heracleum sosnowskyi]|uniref:Fibrillarin-like n=1 Tax=Heracleum sosnowskyi TaxID=360622 RepID=A0AAD8IKG2_9APIA|nr:putative fibrillarin-like [Heracleum sosnowskyi]